ncbi:MAG: hypothetical protein NTW55_02920 [Planctomycetota bacterium]|nr:hypothetical protein [Planctomycetota bacterium]
MDTEQNQVPQDIEKLKEIPRLARRYAENRTVPMIVFFLVPLVLVGMGFLSGYCFLKGIFILRVIMIVLCVAVFIYFMIAYDRYEARYFVKSGISQIQGIQQIRKYLPLPLILCVILSVILEHHGVFSAHLRQPVSALFLCPLLLFANWRWVKDGFIGYLWAGLYGLWAIAILFKVPILTFPGRWAGHELVAVPVTGLITGLVAYIYSRYALKKLKTTAHLQENNNEQGTK